MMMLSLDDREWREFFIDEVCVIHSGVRLTKAEMLLGNTPFIGSSDSNNGITAFTGSTNSSKKRNVLGVNYNGSVVESFYHPYDALFSDDVKQLEIMHETPTEYMYLFLKAVILKQKSKYAYGYKFNAERMKRQIILLPIDQDGKPDWQFMNDYIKEHKEHLIRRQIAFLEHEIDSIGGGGTSISKNTNPRRRLASLHSRRAVSILYKRQGKRAKPSEESCSWRY